MSIIYQEKGEKWDDFMARANAMIAGDRATEELQAQRGTFTDWVSEDEKPLFIFGEQTVQSVNAAAFGREV